MHYALINLSVMAFFGLIGGTILLFVDNTRKKCSSHFLTFLLWVGYCLHGCIFAPATFAIGIPMLILSIIGCSLHNVSLKDKNKAVRLRKVICQDWFGLPVASIGFLGGIALTAAHLNPGSGPDIASFYINILHVVGNFLVQIG